ncbi:MAG TPA: hypothetical protein VGD64_01795 [Acidisarcina sp.]
MEPEFATKADLEVAKLKLLERVEAAKLEVLERMEATRLESSERMERTETTLLKEFRKWAVRFEAIVRVNEASVVGFNARLASLEERVNDLESPQH